jgi:hypothetical protein
MLAATLTMAVVPLKTISTVLLAGAAWPVISPARRQMAAIIIFFI